MIKLHRTSPVPAHLLKHAPVQTQGLIDAFLQGHSPNPSKTYYGHPTVKARLNELQGNKCCFCEINLTGQFGDVEHFRPKKQWQASRATRPASPGYFWLAYEWENLMLSCGVCNIRYKGNLFPLEDETKRADPAIRDISQEVPLLLNPYVDDPEVYIAFDRWDILSVDENARGNASIDTYGLEDEDLVERRRDRYRTIKRLLEITEVAFPSPERDECIEQLREAILDHSEFAAMIRANFASRIQAL